MIRFEIKPEVVEWLVQEWVQTPEMAQELIEGLMGMMIAYGGITEDGIYNVDGPLAEHAPALLKVCEAARRYIGEIMVTQDNYKEAVDVLHQLDAAIAAVRGEV